MSNLAESGKKALATFIFATTGVLVTAPVLGTDTWKVAIGTGLGALINWAYRWSETYLKHK